MAKEAKLPVLVSMLQVLLPPSAGSGSLRLRPLAVPVPVLVRVTVKPAVPPATTEAASAVLLTVTLGERTFSAALDCWLWLVSLEASTVAVLFSVVVKGEPLGVVMPTMWTVRLAPAASVFTPEARVRDCAPAAPVRAKEAKLPVLVSMLQVLLPPSAGSGSLRLRPLAVPVPVLVRVTVKPAVPPAVIEAASAVLLTATLGE